VIVKYPLIWFVKGWRKFISPLYGDVCKYHPTCSAYGLRALEARGAVIGVGLIVARLVRCQPWSKGGVDYVPGTPERLAWEAQEASTNHEVDK